MAERGTHHLPRIRELGPRLHSAYEAFERAECDLALALQAAHADGIPVLRLARESGLSRRRVERLLLRDFDVGD